MLSRGELRLLLNSATGSGGAAQPMPDGRRPEPGRTGARFRNDIVVGNGGRQILVEDPAGNAIRPGEKAWRT